MKESTHTFRGKTFRMLEGSTHPAYSLTCFETEEKDFREQYWDPKPGQVVVDAGASYGSYTLSAAAMGATVIAFEPDNAIFLDLLRNVEENGFQDRVTIQRLGLWDRTDSVDLKSYAPHWPAGTVANTFAMVPLDSFDLQQVDWLKIDIEGAEAHALRGAVKTIARCKPTLIVEVHTFLDPTLMAKCEAAIADSGVEYWLEEVSRGECAMLIGRAA